LRESGAALRARAARVLADVISGTSLDRALEPVSGSGERALLHEFVYGTIRHWFSLNEIIDVASTNRLRERDLTLRCLVALGAHQILHMRIPAHAAVNETVAAAPRIGRTSAKGLVNRILRRVSAEPIVPTSEEGRFDHPLWLIDRVRTQRPNDWRTLLEVDNGRAPMALRVNRARVSRDAYRALLDAAGLAHRIGFCDSALVLERATSAADLPRYTDGWVSVQDEGAQLAAELFAPKPHDRALDACAAPGGKALACLERAPADLLAIDIDEARCEATRREFRRLGFDAAAVRQGDATRLDWWDGRLFERILLDAPCSGTGTLRRHPDIKVLKRESDVPAYQRVQLELLASLWRVLAPGGTLLYCTCSILDEENEQVASAFVSKTTDAAIEPIVATCGEQTPHGLLLLPTEGGPDGFYYAKLTKKVS
jgi:16S rRNA (cytosine967-C5)-methyltransferase